MLENGFFILQCLLKSKKWKAKQHRELQYI
jgi:hypothetical protein